MASPATGHPPKNPDAFRLEIAKFANQTNSTVSAIVRRTALDVYGRIAKRTPVDTGRARGGWGIAIGTVPGPMAGPTRKTARRIRLTTAPPLDAGLALQALSRLVSYDARKGQSIFIANAVNYIRYLEYGTVYGGPHSKQAPRGMVRVTLAEFSGIVKENAKDVPFGGD